MSLCMENVYKYMTRCCFQIIQGAARVSEKILLFPPLAEVRPPRRTPCTDCYSQPLPRFFKRKQQLEPAKHSNRLGVFQKV